jgi:hypothetical protein
MVCLHCGKRLALLRRMSNGEFCTPEHRSAFQLEQQRLALNRLIEVQQPVGKPIPDPELPPLFQTEQTLISEALKPALKGHASALGSSTSPLAASPFRGGLVAAHNAQVVPPAETAGPALASHFLNVAPLPRRASEYLPQAAEIIGASVEIALPEAFGIEKRSARSDRPFPLKFSHQPAAPAVPGLSDLSSCQSAVTICRPESLLTIDCVFSPLLGGTGGVLSEPPMAESLECFAAYLCFQAGSVETTEGPMRALPEFQPPFPLKPTAHGRTKWISEFMELTDNLPMAGATVMAGWGLRTAKFERASPTALLGNCRTEMPGFAPLARRERAPRSIGRLQRKVAVSKLALHSRTSNMEAWREEQVREKPFAIETVDSHPRFRFIWPLLSFTKYGQAVPLNLMPDAKPAASTHLANSSANAILRNGMEEPAQLRDLWLEAAHCQLRVHNKPCEPAFKQFGQRVRIDFTPRAKQAAVPNGANALRKAEGFPAIAPRLKRALGGQAISPRKLRGAGLRRIALSEVPREYESAKPIARMPEEFRAWLHVPLFTLEQKSRCGGCANLSGKTGLEEILASPRVPMPARSDAAEPSHSVMAPAIGKSRLTTIRPPLLTRKEKLFSAAEEELRNDLSFRFKTSGMTFWRQANVTRKWIALSLPILVIIVFQTTIQLRNSMAASKQEAGISQQIAEVGGPEPPTVQAGSTPPGTTEGFFDRRIRNLKLNLAERAGIDLTDDFRSGLTGWEGRGDWARTWTYDRNGLLRPGQLALYGASMGLSDYTFEFRASAERGSMSWVFRARDLNNYYGMRLQIMKSGHGSQGTLERWIVWGGREYSRKYLTTRMPVWEKNIVDVRVDVQGYSFTTFVNGQIADTWTDRRIDSGGIGFFNDKGSESRIYRMTVSHQNDLIGKLCAMLAPHDLVFKRYASEGKLIR